MQIRAVAILALCASQFHHSFAREFNMAKNSRDMPADRLLTLMQNLYVTGENRVRQLQHQRAQHENTLHFETGYVMGEIIERYRQLVLHVKNAVRFKNYKVYDKLIRLEFVQKLYFEIYHLVMMMHELPRKYEGNELTWGAKSDNFTLAEVMANFQARERQREEERRQRLKEARKIRTTSKTASRSRRHAWPIDYGWSIERW